MKTIRIINKQLPDDWISQCPVDGHHFAIKASNAPDNPYPNGCFCPDCQERGLMAPGVLHFERRSIHAPNANALKFWAI